MVSIILMNWKRTLTPVLVVVLTSVNMRFTPGVPGMISLDGFRSAAWSSRPIHHSSVPKG